MTEVVLHGMHLATDFFEAVVDVLEFHTGLAKLFILAPKHDTRLLLTPVATGPT